MADPGTSEADSDLVAGIARGDRAAEGAFYERYADRVFYLALSERWSREDAEDIRAETFLRVLQALREGKLRKPGSLSSFIVGIALNVMREQKRRRPTADGPADADADVVGGESPEDAFANRETAESVAKAIRRLRPREREFLRMYYYEELPREQIARALGIKVERLRLMKSRALKRFREIYRRRERG